MIWQYALLILAVINITSVILSKVATDSAPKKANGIFYQYLFCAIIAIFLYVFSGNNDPGPMLVWIGIVGLINAFGNYFQWRAFEISLSRSVLFLPLMEVWAVLLAILFLREGNLWNFQLILGAGLCFMAMWLFRLPKNNNGKKSSLDKKWLFYTLGMVMIFGTASFLLKVFSYTVNRETFLMAWYGGAFLGSIPILMLEKQNPLKVSKKTLMIVLPLSLAIIGSLFALYWTYQLGGPISLVSPLKGVLVTTIPIVIGWFLFKEKKTLSKAEKLGFLAGMAGIILILLR